MELQQLRYFVAVVETGSFSRAAERCHVAQPSLSQQIKKLEEHVGHRLFDRLGRTVVPTEAGRMLYGRVQGILVAITEAEVELRDAASGGGRRIAVGAIPTIAPYLLPAAIDRLAKRRPGVEVSIYEDLTRNVVSATAAGELDLAVVALPIDDPRLDVTPLSRESLLVALPPGHRLAERKSVRLADLEDEPFILLSEMHCLGESIASFCKQRYFQPRVACRSAQLATVERLVEMGMGVSLIPEMARRKGAGAPVYRPVAGVQPERSLATVSHRSRHRSALAIEFTAVLGEVAAQRG